MLMKCPMLQGNSLYLALPTRVVDGIGFLFYLFQCFEISVSPPEEVITIDFELGPIDIQVLIAKKKKKKTLENLWYVCAFGG